MIEIPTQLGPARIMEYSVDGIPDLSGKLVFADVETTSFDDDVEAFDMWAGHRVCGVAITFDKAEGAWYFPIRHKDWDNYPPNVLELIKGEKWINHNVKFDQHFTWQDGHSFDGDLVCTAVQSKMVDSDRMSHELKPLCRERGMPMEEEEQVKGYLASCKSKDYGRVPADIMGRYACMDVMGNRRLYWELMDEMETPESLWRTEIDFTSVLVRLERRGLKINERQCKVELAKCLRDMIEAGQYIEDETGLIANGGHGFAYDLICGHLDLPILARTKKADGSVGGPSFNKKALLLYEGHPRVVTNPKAQKLIDALRVYRLQSHWKGLFPESLLAKQVDGVVHPSYNQVVRTGRMSCSNPNAQQMDNRAKGLFVPRGAYASSDASQIEFRLICHYMRDMDIIGRYEEDPRTDFHQWVADLCEIERKPAKTINFAIAYGAGKKSITSQLMANKDMMARFACDDPREYEARCRQHALHAYLTYHERLPGIRRIKEKADGLCRRRGYIRNYYGRRRHLPRKQAHNAMNAMIQGGAMDFIKRRMVALDRYDPNVLVANVHDEVLMEGEHVEDPQFKKDVLEILESRDDGLRVPITWDWGTSQESWQLAGA